ncbi:threonine/serine exporter family protein [Propionibacterium freudenreichii]|uniref:threonine/serine ThrE exporter family protein n=1 Tax=Propionibacterium freudenreichii TaxID=1744 RepID=UPI0021A7A5C6|nr:threonine/serine exporter family protein [Propionibacterium freudenreichii]MCT2996587.1 threonine/serine exporter family protein [Propionibacterium freudenreichii]
MIDDSRHDRDFIDGTEAVVRLGSMLLSAGTGAYRVKHAMARAAEAIGMDRHDASVSLTEIITTTHKGDNFRTVVREVPRVAVDASRIGALERLARALPDGSTARELEDQLDHIARHVRGRWPWWVNMLAAGIACAAFAVLNHFSLTDAVLVFFGAACGQGVRRALAKRGINQFGTAALAAATASSVYLLLTLACRTIPWRVLHGVDGTGYVAAILFLIPGFPMITSILDIARLDFTAGLPRAFYALAIILSAGAAAWAVSLATGLQPLVPGAELTGVLWWVGNAAATFVGICGFAVMFNSTRTMMLRAAIAGMVANMMRLYAQRIGMPTQMASLVGGFVVGMLAWMLAKNNDLPRITLSVPGAVIMVPGTSMYRTMYWFNAHDITQSLAYGTDALVGVMALAAGLAVARMCTDPGWTMVRWRRSPHAFLSSDAEFAKRDIDYSAPSDE